MDHRAERSTDVEKIKASGHPRKVVVAGPGTGKSFLFSELIREKIKEGKRDFLAITFIGKLSDALADDLCGLAETVTMHGLARKLVLNEAPDDWVYYPNILSVIKEDLETEGVKKISIGDEKYREKTLLYKAVGDADVVHYAVQMFKKDEKKIPKRDLILIDEFQDFNSIESEFVDYLAKKNEIVIVGDDDQALYEFKGSSPAFIREKFDSSNSSWEGHTLRFCSRCTEVIIRFFHSLVDKYKLNNRSETDVKKRRIEKDYICYLPKGERDSKVVDSQLNPKIHLIKSCPTGMIAYKIKEELMKLCSTQKIKDVLVIGEPRTCISLLDNTARILRGYGFRFVAHPEADAIQLNRPVLDAYGLLSKNDTSVLGWRLLSNPSSDKEKKNHLQRAVTLKKVLERTPVADSSIDKFLSEVDSTSISDADLKKDMTMAEIRRCFMGVSRPVSNLDITVCNILGSKGLGADVVFVLGFDQGRLPKSKTPTSSEVYQMLVAITRAKKRIYLINTVGKPVSMFTDCLARDDLEVEDLTRS